jgi:two-component system response regulator
VNKEIQILLVEDIPADAALVIQALSHGGLNFSLARVDNKKSFLHELQRHPPDVILADHGLPSFDGFTAVAMARQSNPDAPVIFVSGSPRREFPAEFIDDRVVDFVPKSRLDDLVPAVQRAVRDSEIRRLHRRALEEREQTIAELRTALSRLKSLTEMLHICSGCRQILCDDDEWHSLEDYLHGYLNTQYTHGLCPGCVTKFFGERDGGSAVPAESNRLAPEFNLSG